MELDDTVCHCFHITKRKVMNFIRVERPRVPSQIANCGGRGDRLRLVRGLFAPVLRRIFADEFQPRRVSMRRRPPLAPLRPLDMTEARQSFRNVR